MQRRGKSGFNPVFILFVFSIFIASCGSQSASNSMNGNPDGYPNSANRTVSKSGIINGGGIQLPRTGQTTCYDSSGNVISCTGTGEDGEYQDGAPWPSPRFIDNGDQTLTDSLTGLIWPKADSASPPSACTGYGGSMTWQAALNYVACLNANNYLGHNDWRMPNINELVNLLNLEQPANGAWLNANGFNASSMMYWSSTSDTSDPTRALAVDFYDGCINRDTKSTTDLVRSVRGGQCGTSGSAICLPKTGQVKCYDGSGNTIACAGTGEDGELQEGVTWPSPRFTDNGDETVTDNLTNLMWTKNAYAPGPAACNPGTTKTWQSALNYVACLNSNNYLGHNDWKLPNRNEMRSIVDYSQYNPDIPAGSPFISVQPNMYWTSTTDTYFLTAWIVNIYRGYVGMNYTDNNYYYVWPVRLGASLAPPAPVITLNTSSLNFSASAGTNPANQTISLSNGGGGTLSWTATADQTSPAWLSVSPGSGTGNATLTVSVNSAGLAAGTYTKTITIAAPGATNTPQTVNVTLTVNNATTPIIALGTSSLNFNTAFGTNPANQTISLSNGGGGTLSWTAIADQTSPAWLSVSPGSGTGNATLTVSVNSSSLAVGTYTKTITITAPGATNSPQTVNVTLTVNNATTPIIALSTSTLHFRAFTGTNPKSQTISLSNSGAGIMSWTATADKTSPAWLSVSPGSGTGNATLTVSVKTSGLASGTFTKTITITAPGAANSPQIVTVTLDL